MEDKECSHMRTVYRGGRELQQCEGGATMKAGSVKENLHSTEDWHRKTISLGFLRTVSVTRACCHCCGIICIVTLVNKKQLLCSAHVHKIDVSDSQAYQKCHAMLDCSECIVWEMKVLPVSIWGH